MPVTVFYVLLAAAAVIAIDLRIVLIPAGSASILLTAAGFYTSRHIRGALAIPVPAKEAPAEMKHIVVLEAIPVSSQGYDQELIVAVRVRHLVELLACAALGRWLRGTAGSCPVVFRTQMPVPELLHNRDAPSPRSRISPTRHDVLVPGQHGRKTGQARTVVGKRIR